jgi:hypothetical protein
MTITAARVEVLTAEVRVLMVGSRQVTLSVFRQLDRVDSALIQPFGRVRDKPANPGSDRVTVVGRSARPADHGALVRLSLSAQHERQQAWIWRSGREPIYDGDRDDGGPMTGEEREREAQACEARARIVAEWAALPLIVLAGLR